MLSLLFIWQPIILVLLDITPMMGVLDGVLMELQDCALPLLKGQLGSGGGRRGLQHPALPQLCCCPLSPNRAPPTLKALPDLTSVVFTAYLKGMWAQETEAT